jgi:predicted transcriptional regulator
MNILKQFSDERSFALFEAIRENGGKKTPVLISALSMSRKQYYSRLVRLREAGLIRKRKGEYSLTSFGRIVAHALEIISKGQEDYWKLEAIDLAPVEHSDKLRAVLITDVTLKRILFEMFR